MKHVHRWHVSDLEGIIIEEDPNAEFDGSITKGYAGQPNVTEKMEPNQKENVDSNITTVHP